jgi:hypothetical protein
LYRPRSHWPDPEEKEKNKKEWEEECNFDLVLYICGVELKYELVPSEHVIGYFCGYMVDYKEVGICF